MPHRLADQPWFSVVIALYNKAPYIASALESVLHQNFSDFEIIVIDDGSTDGGGDHVAAIDDARIRLVRQPNEGVSRARNLGISLARGKWVAFLDADDWLHPGYLEALVKAQQRFPASNFVASQFLELPDWNDAKQPPRFILPSGTALIEEVDDLVSHWPREATLCASSFAVRKALLDSMQPCFVPGESFGEDVELWFRLNQYTAMILVRHPLVAYRTDVPGSLCNAHPKLQYPTFLRRMKDNASQLTRLASQGRAMLQLVDHFEVSLAREALMLGEREHALQILMHSSRLARSMRWWSTASMLALPKQWVARWQAWRIRRRAPDLQLE
jgi:cellulose synthase/poly-beta-1,6-N-acetylglucosamine synthase-like glycosyltransferase